MSNIIHLKINLSYNRVINNPNIKELFFIPQDFKYIDRKEAQKTLIRAKKRMVLVNVLT